MRRMWAVCRREFASYFVTPMGYVALCTFAAISGIAFTANFINYCRVSQSPRDHGYTSGIPDFEETMLSTYLVLCGQLILFIGPLITMRLLAEERNRGTMELLLTHPLRDRDIVFGKYLAALGMLVVMMGVLAVHLGLVAAYTDVEWAVLAFGLLTVFLMGAAFLSLGLFVSAMTSNQLTAGLATFGLWFVSYVLGTMGKYLPDTASVPADWPAAATRLAEWFYLVFRRVVLELPLDAHAEEMAQGVVQPQDIAYYVLFAVFFLFLTFRALESRQWRA